MNPIGRRRDARTTRLPEWLVAASHGVWQVTPTERSWVPYSVRHAHEVGAPMTACGQVVAGWELVWDIPFDADDSGACELCSERVPTASSATHGHEADSAGKDGAHDVTPLRIVYR